MLLRRACLQVHAVEAFTSRHKKNPLSDLLAREALQLLGNSLEVVLVCSSVAALVLLQAAWRDGADLAARADCLLGSTLAGLAFSNSPTAGCHALAYPLGAVHGVLLCL